MGWSQHRIEEFRQGQQANWLERRMLEHANPIHFPLALAASAGFICGLWLHNWLLIIGSSILAFSGHLYCWTRKYGEERRETQRPGTGASSAQVH